MRKSACFISQLGHAGKMPLWYRHHSHILCWDCEPLPNVWEKNLLKGSLPRAPSHSFSGTAVPHSFCFFPLKGSHKKKQTKQISSLLARTSVLGKPKDGLCSSWLAGVHSEQLSWEDFHSWYLILLPIKSRKMLLLTIHNTRRDAYNTNLGTFSCYKVSRFKLVILSFAPGQQNMMPFTGRWLTKENPSGVLQLQEHKYFTTTLSSAFSKPTNPSRKLPRKPLWC